MIMCRSAREIECMREAGRIVAEALALCRRMAAPGLTTEELDREAESLIRRRGGVPLFKGYRGYPKSVSASVNEEVVHGIPGSRALKDGCDKATVYRLLTRLETHGIIRRLGLHNRSAYYSMLFPGHHDDYLICTECGAIEKLDLACPVEKLEAQISRESGFRKLYHELEFFGVCPACG